VPAEHCRTDEILEELDLRGQEAAAEKLRARIRDRVLDPFETYPFRLTWIRGSPGFEVDLNSDARGAALALAAATSRMGVPSSACSRISGRTSQRRAQVGR